MRKHTSFFSTPKDQEAYKGYLIKYGSGYWHVSKDGHHITSQATLEQAKSTVDEIA